MVFKGVRLPLYLQKHSIMKKVVLIKNFQAAKKGDTVELKTGRADYLVRMGVARDINADGSKKATSKPKVTKSGKKELKNDHETKELKSNTKTKKK